MRSFTLFSFTVADYVKQSDSKLPQITDSFARIHQLLETDLLHLSY
jgi:hypothetical protein